MGSFPIAQLRDPYSVVKYLGERLDLVKVLRITHPDDDEEWSAMDICDGSILLGFRENFWAFSSVFLIKFTNRRMGQTQRFLYGENRTTGHLSSSQPSA